MKGIVEINLWIQNKLSVGNTINLKVGTSPGGVSLSRNSFQSHRFEWLEIVNYNTSLMIVLLLLLLLLLLSFRVKWAQRLFSVALIQRARWLLQKAGRCNEPNKHQSHLLSRETNSNYDFCYVSLLNPFVVPRSPRDRDSFIYVWGGEGKCVAV